LQLIDTTLLVKVIEPLWLEKPETASRLRGHIESILNWCAASAKVKTRRAGAATSINYRQRGQKYVGSNITARCRIPNWRRFRSSCVSKVLCDTGAQ
jgi:hypothetical protein